jgi:hypothetical protein
MSRLGVISKRYCLENGQGDAANKSQKEINCGEFSQGNSGILKVHQAGIFRQLQLLNYDFESCPPEHLFPDGAGGLL